MREIFAVYERAAPKVLRDQGLGPAERAAAVADLLRRRLRACAR